MLLSKEEFMGIKEELVKGENDCSVGMHFTALRGCSGHQLILSCN